MAEQTEAFWARVDRSGGPDACWPWTGAVHRKGYGAVTWGGRQCYAHRVAWFLATGSWPPPETPHVLHAPVICHNPACCNPLHLRVGTQRENALDRRKDGTDHNASKTHCPKGHPYDEGNTRGTVSGRRICRECDNRASRIRMKNLRATRKELVDG